MFCYVILKDRRTKRFLFTICFFVYKIRIFDIACSRLNKKLAFSSNQESQSLNKFVILLPAYQFRELKGTVCKMNDEEYEAELSEDDADYIPGKEAESVSENSAPEPDDPENSDDEGKTKKIKRRKKATRRSKPVESEDEEEKYEPPVDPEEAKKKAEALWADFLSGTEIPLDSKKDEKSNKPTTSTASTSKPAAANIPKPKEIFEFAGETIDIPKKSCEEQETSAEKSPTAGAKRASASGGGLSSLLGQIAKKNKLSVLEKTKIDWDGFKSKEGIGEELQTHNRGRDG